MSEVKKLYNALLSKGYTTQDLGDENTFTTKMSDANNRKELYDWVSSRGDFRLGEYEDYEKRLYTPIQQRGDTLMADRYSVAPDVADIPQAPSAPTADKQEPITTFGGGVKQGAQQLGAGLQYFGGEVADKVSETAADNARALQSIEQMQSEGKDVAKETRLDAKGVFLPLLGHSTDAIGTIAGLFQKDNGFNRAVEEVEVDKLIRKALKETGGDVEAAKALIAERANEQTVADKWREKAEAKMNEAKPTEGFAAFAGEMVPQMVGTLAGLGLSAITKSPLPAQALGLGQMAALTASTAGSSMKEARDAGASTPQVWGAGLADAVVELATEAIPFKRLTRGISANAKRKIGEGIADAMSDPNSPAGKELQNLLTRANKKLGGKLLSGKTAKEFIEQAGIEGMSEFTAEALQTITPMLYEEPENYPTFSEIFNAGLEGFKGGVFMGGILGGASQVATNRTQRDRRKQQGYVDVAEVQLKNGVELVEVLNYDRDNDVVEVIYDNEVVPIQNASQNILRGHRYTYEEFEKGVADGESEIAYEKGRTTETPAEKNDAYNRYKAEEENMRNIFSLSADTDVEEYISSLSANPYDFAIKQREKDEEVGQATLDFLNAKAEMDGIFGQTNDNIDNAIAQSDAIIDSRVSKTDGLIHPATLTIDSRKVYIVSGNVATLDDGTIDTSSTEKAIIIKDATTGKTEFVDASAFSSVEPTLDPTQEKAVAAENITNTITTQAENDIEGILPFAIGDTYDVMDDNGVAHTATILANDGQGNVQIRYDNEAEPTSATTDIVQSMADAFKMQQVRGRKAETKVASDSKENEVVTPNMEDVTPTRVVPMQKDGVTPDYNAMDAEMFVEEFVPRFGEERAVKLANKNIESAQKEMAKIDKQLDEAIDPNKIQQLDTKRKEYEAQFNRYQDILGIITNKAEQEATIDEPIAESIDANTLTAEESKAFDENFNEINNVFEDERSTENADVPTSVSAEDGVADGNQTSIEMVQRAEADSTLGDRGSIEAGQGSNEGNVGEGVADVPSADVSGAEEVDNGYNGQEADIFDEDIEALWIKSRDELWKPDDEIGQILHEKLYEAHPETHQPEDRKRVVRHLIEAAEKYKDHPIAKEVLKYVKYPQTTSMRVSPLTNREEMRRKPLRARAKMWEEKVGIKVNLIETFEEIPTDAAKRAVEEGQRVTGWVVNGEVFLYMPNIANRTEIDSTYLHEVVAHVGMKNLLTKEGYEAFCERVFNEVMTKAQQDYYSVYPGVRNKAMAADEFIAHLAEDTNMNASAWQKIVRFFKDALRSMGMDIHLTNADIQDMLRDSYRKLAEQNGAVDINEQEGQAMFSIRTYNEGGKAKLDKFLNGQVKKKRITKDEAEEIANTLDEMYDIAVKYKDQYAPFGAWSEAKVVENKDGMPAFSVIKKNGDYSMNLDFSTVCKKRRTLDAVFSEMIERGLISNLDLDGEQIAEINNIIRRYGFETACALCFVDAKRFRVAQVADKFCEMWNPMAVMTNEQLQEVINEEGDTVRSKVAKYLLENPDNRIQLKRENFIDSHGFEEMEINNPEILSLYKQAQGTSLAKIPFGDVQYLNDLEARHQWTPDKAYAVGGVRLQSFSDYVPRMFFDYMQLMADLSAKNLPVHAYTKEPIFAKQFGLTGTKINLSLVPKVVDGGVSAGLDANGNYAWMEGETFPYEEAIALQDAEGYRENCGTIAVGVSDAHIEKLLDDPNIRMVIPYHKSGLNPLVAKKNRINEFVDYTNVQNTRSAEGTKLESDDLKDMPNFNALMHFEGMDARQAAQAYLDWCDSKGYLPKFDKWRNHPNYYKLLEDFTTIVPDANGVETTYPQTAVTMTFPTEESAFGSIESLIQEGLEEDAVLEGRRDANVGKIVDTIEEELVQFRFIGEVGASNIDKAEEATTRLDNLAIAREMEAADKSAKSIKMATGWERGADGKWRYEVDDVELKISPSQVFDDLEEKDLYLFDVLSDESFDKLIAEYPELGDVALSMDVSDGVGYASWDDEKHYILVTQNAYKYPGHLPSAIVHELQHAIQKIEGFAYGSNPLAMMRDIIAEKYGDNSLVEVAQEDIDGRIAYDLYSIRYSAEGLVQDGKYKYLRNAIKSVANTYITRGWINSRTVQYFGPVDSTEELVNDIANVVTDGTLSQWQSLPIDIRDGWEMATEKYRRVSGEVEARNASARMGMTIDERRESLAVDTEDVARKDQIFIEDALGEANTQFRITPEEDARYLQLVEEGNLEEAQKMVNAVANAAGYNNDVSWKKAHTAPRKSEDNVNPFNTEELVPADYWTHPEWYTNIRNSADDRESYYNMVSAINKYKRLVAEGKQDEADKVTVTMYRGVDKTANAKESTFRNGDWITPSRSYAKWSAPEGRSRVIEQEVPLKNIWWDGNSINEWGYDDGENYVYKDTKNNRKLADAVTYDDNGNVIPLSKRFNSRNADVRFRISDKKQAKLEQWYGGIAEKYNIDGDIRVMPSQEDFYQVLLDNGVKEDALAGYDKAAYLEGKGIFLINGERINDNIEAERAIFHELWHKFTREIITLQGLNWVARSISPNRLAELNDVYWSKAYKTQAGIIDELISSSIEFYIEAEVESADGTPISALEAYLNDNISLYEATELAMSKMSEAARMYADVWEKIFFETERNLTAYKKQYYGKKENRVSKRGGEGTQPSPKQVLEGGHYQADGGGVGGSRPNRLPEQERGEGRGSQAIDSLLNDVAQKSLREMVGEQNYNDFLMRALRDANEPTRRQIVNEGMRNGLDFLSATNNYLASLAEQDNVDEVYLNRVNGLMSTMLNEAGVDVGEIGNDALRYVLWRNNLQDNGAFSVAEDVVMKQKLGVGKFSTQEADVRPRYTDSEAKEISFRIREQEPPKNTGIGYKVFVLKDGKLYPPMVANPDGADTPVGVWLDADAAPISGTSKTGRSQVKAGGKGTQGGSGSLAYRPGWHLGSIPYALQFNRKNPDTGERELFPNNFVWAEVDYANDVDYQEEAMSYGYNKNGKFQHSYAGLPRVPENGAYIYRTNPNPETDPWVITGAMKVNRLLTPSEVDEMVIAAGRTPQLRQESAVTDADVEQFNEENGLADTSFRVVDKDELLDRIALYEKEFDNAYQILAYKNDIRSTFRSRDTYDYIDGRIEDLQRSGENDRLLQWMLAEREKRDFGKKAREKANELQSYLESEGWKSAAGRPTTSYTDVGTSTYLTMEAPQGGSETFRISDHPLYGIRSVEDVPIPLDADVAEFIKKEYPSIKETQKRGVVNVSSANTQFRVKDEPTTPLTGEARRLYEKAVRRHTKENDVKKFDNLWHQLREGYQDSMLSVKALQDAILAETGNKLQDYEDVYTAENQLSSRNQAEIEKWERDFMRPLQEQILALINEGASYSDIVEYLLAKHGLERNVVIPMRDAEAIAERWEKKRLDGADKAYKYEKKRIDGSYGGQRAALRKNLDTGVLTQEQYANAVSKLDKAHDKALKQLERKYEKLVERIKDSRSEMYEKAWTKLRGDDYSGLTELTGEAKAFTEAAQKMVDMFEKRYNTDALWARINAATKESLRKTFNSGLMNKETFDKVSSMFEYYIPLRGWDNNVAADLYDYMGNKGMKIMPALKTAKGRTSRADDPIATLGSVGESSIIQGNRNLMKQKLLNLAQGNPTSLLTVNEQWYVKQADGTWKMDSPIIPIDATGEEVDKIIKDHEAKMLSLGENATKSRKGLEIDLHTTQSEQEEHAVSVKRNGKEYKVYVNGNPIAAQAINGFTNPNANKKDSWEWLEQKAMWVKNFMARAFTSRNPAFIFVNLARDLMWSGTSLSIKEGAKYNKQYVKNIASAFGKYNLPSLISKWEKGTLNMDNPVERYFSEFITNGGETGHTQLNTVDDYKRNIEQFIKEAQGGAVSNSKKAWRWIWDNVEFLNRSAEDTTRFTVYMTSRQMGRSITESVANAKDVTVNFNKKGRGTFGANVLGFAYIFFNASIQSLANFGKLVANHPKKTTAALTTFASSGMIAPLVALTLQSLMGDDDEPTYWDLPEWVRRNNIVLYVGGSGYVTIPLPHELRPFYGMGELAFSVLNGKEEVDEALKKSVEVFASLLPLDYTGNAGNVWVNITPTIAQPVAQLIINKDYFGTPIYRKTAFNEKDPEWTKAYKSTNQTLVDATEFVNELTGGDAVKSGMIDLNPAIIEHIFESYFGGMGKTINRTAKTFSMLWNEDMREWRNVPVLSSFYTESNERTSGSQLNREYYDAVDEAEDVEHLYSGYNKQAKMGSMEYAEKLNELMESPIFKRYQIVKGYKNAISKLSTQLKEAGLDEMDELETLIMNLKVEMLEELEELESNNK